MRRVKFTVLLAALAAGAAQMSYADAFDGAPLSLRVDYSDLNLQQPAGAKVLYQRLLGAAHEVCKSFESRDIWLNAKHDNCVRDAMSAAVANVNSPLLTNLHKAKVGDTTQQVAQLVK